MNLKALICVSLAERKLIEKVLVQDEVNTIQEFLELARACCDLYNRTFCGEIAEA